MYLSGGATPAAVGLGGIGAGLLPPTIRAEAAVRVHGPLGVFAGADIYPLWIDGAWFRGGVRAWAPPQQHHGGLVTVAHGSYGVLSSTFEGPVIQGLMTEAGLDLILHPMTLTMGGTLDYVFDGDFISVAPYLTVGIAF